ncbi:MAG: hypothetical protein JWQ35_283 [Bacteriovoracaceae bacterium]|nr:hypothetical protein [Bacteriovoracaceae bacterium]
MARAAACLTRILKWQRVRFIRLTYFKVSAKDDKASPPIFLEYNTFVKGDPKADFIYIESPIVGSPITVKSKRLIGFDITSDAWLLLCEPTTVIVEALNEGEISNLRLQWKLLTDETIKKLFWKFQIKLCWISRILR